MRAIVAAARSGDLNADPRLLISNNAAPPALQFGKAMGLAIAHISASTEGDAEAADWAIADALADAGVELVILSGYLRKLGPEMLRRYRGRILNIHPGLLPRHGGQGMYGRRVHEAVVAAREAETGATVHVVDCDYDTGPVVAQQKVAVESGDSAEDVERRVMAMEPGLFVATLRRLAEGSLILPDPGP